MLKHICLSLLLITCTNSWAGTMKFYAVHTDQLGTPQVITDENKNVVWEADRDPFGKVTNVVTNNFAMNIALPGQYTDAETNYNQNWNRDYDPNTGRYLQSDPIGQRGGVNTYSYVRNNPVMRTDPWGLLDRLEYDGQNLTGWDDMSPVFSAPADSGNSKHDPAPNGVYNGTKLQSPRSDQSGMTCPNGDSWSLNLNPTFDTPRKLLEIHPDGGPPGTQGCIGVSCSAQAPVADALQEYFNQPNSTGSIPVIINKP